MNINDVCGVILNGGGSTRMGTDKGELQIGHQKAVDRIAHTLSFVSSQLVINQNKGKHPFHPTIPDVFIDAGPLGGLHAVMSAREEQWFLLAPCDTPFVQKVVYESVLTRANHEGDAFIPIFEGRHHPLSGLYHRRILDVVESYLHRGGRRVRGLFEEINVVPVKSYPGVNQKNLVSHFFNMNSPGDYETAKKFLKNEGR